MLLLMLMLLLLAPALVLAAPPTLASGSNNCTRLNIESYINRPIADSLAVTDPATLCPEDVKTYKLLRQQLENEKSVIVDLALQSTTAQGIQQYYTMNLLKLFLFISYASSFFLSETI